MNKHKISILALAVTAMLLLGATNAWANAPTQEDFFIVWDTYLGTCDATLQLCERGEGDVRFTIFYSDDGEPKRYTDKYKLFGAVYECGNPDNALEWLPSSYRWSYDVVADEDVFTGLFGMVTVPGYGPVFMDVGRIVVDFDTGEIAFEASEHDWWNGDVDGLCEVFMNGR